MKAPIIGNNGYIAFLATSLLFHPIVAFSSDIATIKMRSTDILFSGDITNENVANFIALYEAQERKPTLVTIQSKGGDASAGLEFGDFILRQGLDVRVLNYCFSSCANYVFTAGKTKYVTKDAIIGWHGSPTSRYVYIEGKGVVQLACDSDAACADDLAKKTVDASLDCVKYTNCDEARPKLIESFKATLSELMSRQHELFKRTGVDERLTTYGQEVHCNCIWTFSVADIRRFNVRNVKDNQPLHFMESTLADFRERNRLKRSTKLLRLPAE